MQPFYSKPCFALLQVFPAPLPSTTAQQQSLKAPQQSAAAKGGKKKRIHDLDILEKELKVTSPSKAAAETLKALNLPSNPNNPLLPHAHEGPINDEMDMSKWRTLKGFANERGSFGLSPSYFRGTVDLLPIRLPTVEQTIESRCADACVRSVLELACMRTPGS
jgi:hypothetical protein